MVPRDWRRLADVGAAALLVLSLAVALAGCSGTAERTAAGLTGGDTARGRRAIERFGCGACHTIPGIDGARARVGPSLEGIAGRAYLAGRLPNTPDNLIRWIRDPQGIEPGNVMPNLGIGTRDARDIAAYLYPLK
jgi:cytochrome c2